MTFYDTLRDDLVARSDELAAQTRSARRSKRRWPLITLAAITVGAGGTVAVAQLSRPATQIARDTAGGPRGIAEGATPVALRDDGDGALWEVAAFRDRAGGLGMAASTTFDPRPANAATAGREVLRELSENGGATVYGVVQIDHAPSHVVVYGAAAPGVRQVRVQGVSARFAERTVPLTAWENERPGDQLGNVRVFAVDVLLGGGLTADRVNGSFVGRAVGPGTVDLRSTR